MDGSRVRGRDSRVTQSKPGEDVEEGDICKLTGEASGETSPAGILTADVQSQNWKKGVSVL